MAHRGARHSWLLGAVAVAVLACSIAIPVSAVARGVVRFGAVTVGASQQQRRPLLILGGPLRLVGESDAPIVVVRGSIVVDGSARDDVIAVGGSIRLASKSDTRANVVSLGGTVVRDASARVEGSVIGSGSPLPSAGRPDLTDFLLVRLRLGVLAMTALLILGLAVWAVLPWPALITTATARQFRLRSALLGVGTLLCAPLIVIPLAVSLAGLPLAALLLLGLAALWLVGLVSSAVRLGHRLLLLDGRPHSLLSATLVGLICLGLLPALPVVGTIALILAGCVGLGAALVALWDRDVTGELAMTAALSTFRLPD